MGKETLPLPLTFSKPLSRGSEAWGLACEVGREEKEWVGRDFFWNNLLIIQGNQGPEEKSLAPGPRGRLCCWPLEATHAYPLLLLRALHVPEREPTPSQALRLGHVVQA